MAKVSISRRLISSVSQKIKAAFDGSAVICMPTMHAFLSNSVRPEIAMCSLTSLSSVFPSEISFANPSKAVIDAITSVSWNVIDIRDSVSSNEDEASGSKPVRIILKGDTSAVLAAKEFFIASGSSFLPVPSVGQCSAYQQEKKTVMHGISSFMRCFPSALFFTGGDSNDHNWLMSRGAVVMNISDSGQIFVQASNEDDSPYWKSNSEQPLLKSLQTALRIIDLIARDFRPPVIPSQHSALANL